MRPFLTLVPMAPLGLRVCPPEEIKKIELKWLGLLSSPGADTTNSLKLSQAVDLN